MIGDILYEPIMATVDSSFNRGPRRLLLKASDLIARLASCKDAPYVPGAPNITCAMRTHRVMPRNMLVTMQKEQSLIAKGDYPGELGLNKAMGCGGDVESRQNFVDQIACGAETFVNRYTDAVGDFSDKKEIFYDTDRAARHGYNCPSGGCEEDDEDDIEDDLAEGTGPIVTFFVKDRMTHVQYFYTPWIQALPDGGGVYEFHKVWNGSRFNVTWRGGSE